MVMQVEIEVFESVTFFQESYDQQVPFTPSIFEKLQLQVKHLFIVSHSIKQDLKFLKIQKRLVYLLNES